MDKDEDIFIESDDSAEGSSEEELDAVESRVDAKVLKLKKELEQCKKDKQEYLDGWQRSKADYVNALKRFEDEKLSATAKGIAKGAAPFIGVIDTLNRAGDIPEAFEPVAKQLRDAAVALGLEQFGAVGDSFDPNLHDALGQDAVDSQDKDDTVTVVLEAGWKLKESVIRPAKVRVGHFG